MKQLLEQIARAIAPDRRRSGVIALATVILVVSLGTLVGGIAFPKDFSSDAPRFKDIRAADPIQLIVPSQHVRAPIVPIAIDPFGALVPPANYRDVGWWDSSAKPGEDSGRTVVVGHTVHTGGGALDNIGDLRPGDELQIWTKGDRRLRYSVDKIVVYSYEEIAKKAVELFSQDEGNGELLLITCTDFDGQIYHSNVLVYGTPNGVIRYGKNDRGTPGGVTDVSKASGR